MKRFIRKTAPLGFALLLAMSACADLDVVNTNSADAQRALSTPGDVESLIAGSFSSWWLASHHQNGPSAILGNQSFMLSSWPANFGMVHYSQIPRVQISNSPTADFYSEMVAYVWNQNYRALAALAQGLNSLEDPDIAAGLGDSRVLRARAYGKFMQGLAHGSLALLYQEAFIIDETVDIEAEQTSVPYTEVMEAALGYFDDAIALSTGASFTVPSDWMSVAVPAEDLARLAHSMKARYRANVARTPDERQAVDWAAVIADVDAGLPEWVMQVQFFSAPFWNFMVGQFSSAIGWTQVSYMIHGMADQSGNYQAWLEDPPADRYPDFADESPVLIHTPDQRFPSGDTRAEQADNPGTHIGINNRPWGQPARGTYRWSHYRVSTLDFHRDGGESVPEITETEMRLLKAEGIIRTNGDLEEAAGLINVTREAAGLAGTDGTGTNTDCVPKLPDGSCGDLMEMMKWEKRMETAFFGLHANTWWFDGRGWGDLYAGTALSVPVPCLEREIAFAPCDTTGGVGGTLASPGSSYNYPHEG